MRRALGVLVLAAVAAASAACGGGQKGPPANRQWTDDLAITIQPDIVPPRAAERITYRVTVVDKKSGQPIETGQGRLFASNASMAKTHNGLAKGAQPGEYTTTLFYPTAGPWAVAMEFRRDSTQRLQRVDWTQEVRPATDSIR